jgi:molybdopterin-guanine dinucleotide biosynthesis protein A
MPLLPPGLIAYMVEHARLTENLVTLYSVNGFPQTFPALLRGACLPLLEAELRAGRLGCFSAFQAAASCFRSPHGRSSMAVLPVEVVVQAGIVSSAGGQPPVRWFSNVNSPVELDEALKGLA